MTLADKKSTGLGPKHWFFQIAPPFLMLLILFTTRSGIALVFLAGFFVLPVLISFFSIIIKLIFFKKRKYHLIRPILTIAMFVLIITIAFWSYDIALDQAILEAEKIQNLCNENLACPGNPSGWIVEGYRISKSNLGVWFKFTASYAYNTESFNIRVYQGPDLGHNIVGGVGRPFEVISYVDG